MTTFDRFENRLPALLDELAVPRLPDYGDDLFARTAATRQRPEWTFIERWLPVSTFTARLVAVPAPRWRFGVLIALVAVAALIATLIAGSIINRRPPPYGPAANGGIVFTDGRGRLVLGDLETTQTRVLADVRDASFPLVSLDGARVAFFRPAAGAGGAYFDLLVVGTDGSALTQLTADPIFSPTYAGWSAHGDKLLIVDRAGRMFLFGTTQAGAPVELSKVAKVGPVEIGPGFNFRSDTAFRPPNGAEILFATSNEERLMTVRPDGSDKRTVVEASMFGPTAHVRAGQWSPDGSTVLFLAGSMNSRGEEEWHPYLANADGTGVHPLSDGTSGDGFSVNSPLWSPDGSTIAFLYWTRAADDGVDVHPIGVVDVATGKLHDVGSIAYGWVSWEWSPDGTSIIGLPAAEPKEDDCSSLVCVPKLGGPSDLVILDVTTGASAVAPWPAEHPIGLQRVAR